VIVAAALPGVILFKAAGLSRTARLVHAGNLDAQALAGKLDKLTKVDKPHVVLIAVALAVVILFIAAGLIWTTRLVYVGNLDAQALIDKLDKPYPVSALDWPELRVLAVIPQPDGPPPLVLLHVEHPRRAATLLVALDSEDRQSVPLLSRWCAGRASVAPVRCEGAELELRRRQSLERVHAVMVAEDTMPFSGD
jgi:hypothetical protein